MAEILSDCIAELVKNGVIAFVPSGNSMWPTLKNKKQSVIVKKKTERLKPFDVALYRRENGTNVLHRVMKVVNDGYIMCGDSQFTLEKVMEDNVFGVMTEFYRGKRCVQVTDADYIAQVKRLFRHNGLRRFRVKAFYLRQRLIGFPIRVLRRIFRKKRKENGEKDDRS